MLLFVQNVFGKGIDRGGLVAAGLKWRMEFKHNVGGLSKDSRTH